MKKILIIEDEESIRVVLEEDFLSEGYQVESASSGTEGFEKALNNTADLIILDIMLPGMDGFEICKKLRSQGINTPIIMLTAKGQEIDRILGLEFGADDYVTKPFSPRELLARVKAILRRMENNIENEAQDIFSLMGFEVDFRNYRCYKNGKEIKLTVFEFGILKYLIQNRGRAINRDEILDEVWGKNVVVTPRSVDMHIANLRKKIENDPANPKFIGSVSTPAQYRMILSTIRELDVIPLQTLIEATIVEVTLRDNLEYGLQWFFRAGDSSFTFSDAASGAVASSFPGFSYALSSTDVQVVLNALTEITDVKVISSPQLLVLDNESARLQIGDEVPIAVQASQSTVDPNADLITTIEYRDTGVILEVTPRVNAGGLVVLEIVQEVSSVSETASSTGNSPIISQRRFESTVAVQGGETIALGGLIQDTRTDSITGVPLLSDIPVLGNLFKTTSDRIDRTELLVLLTPRVVRDLQDARDVTTELRERLTGLDVVTGAEPEG